MDEREKQGHPAPLEKVRRRFVQWRLKRKPHARIPESLWAAAVKMVGKFGLHRTARALQVDYYSLKRRVEESAAGSGETRSTASGAATFVELATAAAGMGECLVELEGADGSKMRVELKGVDVPDVIALSRSFWDAPS
jgi:hypothetical protein